MLTEQQKEIIINSISHLIDLPEEGDARITAINQLYDALITPTIADDHEHAFLHKCLYHPEQMLLRLEDHGAANSLMLGEVQEFIINYINTQAGNAWNQAQINALKASAITLENQTTVFTSQHDVEQHIDFYDLHIEDTRNFSARLAPDGSHIYLELTIRLPDTTPYTDRTYLLNLENTEGYEELHEDVRDGLILTLASMLKGQSIKRAADLTLYYLISKNILSLEDTLNVTTNVGAPLIKLLTNRELITLLMNRKIIFSDIKQVSSEQAAILQEPVILNLIKSSILTVESALNLTSHSMKTICFPYYNQLIQRDSALLEKLKNINEAQAFILTHPAVILQMQNGQLRLEQALKLRKATVQLISDPFYSRKVLAEQVDWEAINSKINRHTIQLLLAPKAIKLFSDHAVPVNNIFDYIPQIIEETRGQRTRDLVMGNYINLETMFLLSSEVVEAIEKHPKLAIWIKRGLLDNQDYEIPSALDLIIEVYYNRLVAIYRCEPFEYNNQTDSVSAILSELQSEDNDLQSYIHETAIKNFLYMVQGNVDERVHHIIPGKASIIYKDIYNKIEDADNHYEETSSPHYWRHCLARIIGIVNNQTLDAQPSNNKIASRGLGFFDARHDKEAMTGLQSFCEKLREFAPLARVTSALPAPAVL